MASKHQRHTNSHSAPRENKRSPLGAGLEELESRVVFSIPAAAIESDRQVESAKDPIVIAAVHLRVGGEEVVVKDRHQVVTFQPQDAIEVVGIDYEVSESASGLDGVIAFEGFVRRGKPSEYLGEFDYADGRFGSPTSTEPITSGGHRHPGLTGPWELDATVNRLSLALVRYFGDDFQAEDRFFVNFQPEANDLVMVRGGYKVGRVGETANFLGILANQGKYAVNTYSEVNVFLAEDLTRPVWVGTFSANLRPGQQTDWIEYRNTNPNDAYAERWTPREKGTYLVKVFADPERVLIESNEENNVRWTTFDVK